MNLSKTRYVEASKNLVLDDDKIPIIGAVHYAKIKPRKFQPSYDHHYSTNVMDELNKKI